MCLSLTHPQSPPTPSPNGGSPFDRVGFRPPPSSSITQPESQGSRQIRMSVPKMFNEGLFRKGLSSTSRKRNAMPIPLAVADFFGEPIPTKEIASHR